MTEVPQPHAKAFDDLFAANHQRIFGLCYRVLQTQDDAIEVAFKVWQKVLGCIREGHTEQLAQNLTVMAAQECVEFLRRRRRSDSESLEAAEEDALLVDSVNWETAEVGELAARVQLDVRLRRAMEALSPKQRVAVVLKYHYGVKTSEVAQMLGCGAGTARTHLRCGLLTSTRFFVPPEKH